MSRLTRISITVLCLFLAVAIAMPVPDAIAGEEKSEERFAQITDWLVLGPVPAPLPA